MGPLRLLRLLRGGGADDDIAGPFEEPLEPFDIGSPAPPFADPPPPGRLNMMSVCRVWSMRWCDRSVLVRAPAGCAASILGKDTTISIALSCSFGIGRFCLLLEHQSGTK